MTDRRELEALMTALRQAGASVHARIDRDGYVAGVTVLGVRGIGPHEMAPLSFAERARSVLAAA